MNKATVANRSRVVQFDKLVCSLLKKTIDKRLGSAAWRTMILGEVLKQDKAVTKFRLNCLRSIANDGQATAVLGA